MSPVATLEYGFQAAPWDSPLSFGVQSFIEYNGYIINDRHQADRVRVLSIVGLDSADITDSRENIPGDEGEFVYDSFYRGRTFLMTGDITAGSLGGLKRLERDLKAAYAPLTESSMKFRWFDIYDSFDDPQTLENYTARIGSLSSLIAGNGVLRWPTTSNVLLTRTADNRLWGDAQTTVRIVVGSVSDTSQVYVVPTIADPNNYLKVAYKVGAGAPVLTISTIIAGVEHVLSSIAISGIVRGQSIWLRGKREGDLVTAEVWTTPPAETKLPTFSTSAWLSGSDSDLLGDQVLSQIGFGAQTVGTNWAFGDFRISTISPCDVVFQAKTLSKISIKDSQDSSTRFKRGFQITMRASKPYAKCATQSRSQALVLTASGTTELGFRSPITAPLIASAFVGNVAIQNNLLFIRNRGTAPERPIIVVYGAISNFILLNLNNDQQLSWSGVLPDGDYLVFDCFNRTLVNSVGANMKKYLSVSIPQWMWLEPDWNDIYVGGSGYSGNTNALAFYRGSFS